MNPRKGLQNFRWIGTTTISCLLSWQVDLSRLEKKRFANLLPLKKEIEGELGFELDWLTQRLVKMDQVLRPIVKALP